MKKKDVPQDKGYLSKANIKEVIYAVDQEGKYDKVQSLGWKIKTDALNESLDLIEEKIKETIEKIHQGELSPIAYYMELHRMDFAVLSGYANIWQWRIKRHLKAKTFKKLSEKVLQKYADAFEISLTELKNPQF